MSGDFKSSSYQLQALSQSVQHSTKPYDFIDAIQDTSTSSSSFYARQNSEIVYYSYDEQQKQWLEKSRKKLFKEEGSPDTYPGYVADLPSFDQPVLILKTIEGIGFYQYDKFGKKIELLALENSFHDVYNWNEANHTIKFGRFYSENTVGVLTRSPTEGVKFYQVGEEDVKANDTMPLWPVNFRNPEIFKQPVWQASKTEFIVVDTRHRGQDDIVLRSSQGLTLFEINPDYSVSKFLETVNGAASDEEILFADLTGQAYQDIVLWGEKGLAVYQYQPKEHDYILLSFSPEFATKKGWKRLYLRSLKKVDLNGDQRDELILTGPKGITVLSFDPEYREWESVLDNTQLAGNKRYAHVVKVLASSQSNSPPSLLLQDQETIRWVSLTEDNEPEIMSLEDMKEAEEDIDLESTFDVRPNVTIPSYIAKADLFIPQPVRLAEQLDYSPIMKAINTLNGQVQFTLPLIELPAISLALSYDSQADTSLLGKGWSVIPPPSYITADFRGSIFEEDTQYYLFNEGQMLVLNQTDSSAFQLGNQTDTKISYFGQKERWQVETLEETLIFGHSSDPNSSSSVQWGLTWPNWRGTGTDATKQEPIAQTWFLSERQLKQNNQVIYYQYESVNAVVPGGKSFTEFVYLKKVTDGKDTSLVINYAPKMVDEYDDSSLIDAEGIIQTVARQRRYLAGYQVNTRDVLQTIQFEYKKYSNKRCLTSIEQIFGDQREKVLQFDYETVKDEIVLARSTIPTGLQVQFSYQVRPPVPVLDKPSRFDLGQGASFVSWSDYSVVGSLDSNNQTVVQLLDEEAVDTYVKSSKGARLPPLGRKNVENYSIVPQQNFFAVELVFDNERDFFLYSRRESVWSWTPKIMTFDKKALVRVGQDYVVVAKSNTAELILYEWQAAGTQWSERPLRPPVVSAKPPKYIAVYERVIVLYDDAIIWLAYRDRKKNWNSKVLKEIPNWASTVQNTLQKFDVEKKTLEPIADFLNRQGLQIQNNFVVLSTIELSSGQLASKIQVMLLDSHYKISQEKLYVLAQETLRDLSAEWKPKDDLIITLDYKENGGKFSINVKSYIENGKSFDEENLDQVRKDLKSNKDNILLKISLVNWSQYQVALSPKGVHCGKNTIDFTGNDWEKSHVPDAEIQGDQVSTRLGKYFILEKSNEKASYKLYRLTDGKKQDAPVLDLMTVDAENVVVRYPAYLAYQPAFGPTHFVEFDDPKTLGPTIKLSGENIYAGSTFQTLVTYSSGDIKTQESSLKIKGVKKQKPSPVPESFHVRSLSSRVSQRDQPIVASRMTSRSGEQSRVIAYQYPDSLNRTEGVIFYPKVITTPAGDKSVSGWVEETRVYNVSSQNFDRQETFFDAKAQIVEKPVQEEKNQNVDDFFKTAETFGESVILDSTKERIIADCSPRLLKDEEVGYYGFESYEVNQIGNPQNSKKKWQFSDKNVKQGFAFTGENYLHLDGTKNNTYFEGTFQPSQQDTTYLASCWLRPSNFLELGTSVPYLKALVTTSEGIEVLGMLGQVKFQSGDWFYLETLVDLVFLKQVYLQQVNDNVTLTAPPLSETTEVLFSIRLTVGPSTNMTIDLDHIRFSPLVDTLQVKVYHPFLDQHTALIQENGLIERKIYRRTNQIAVLEERGQIRSLSSKSVTGVLFPAPRGALPAFPGPKKVVFKPESGFYETFDAYALKSRWIFHDTRAWKTFLGQVRHQHPEWHKIEVDARLLDTSSAALRCDVTLLSTDTGLRWHWNGGYLQLTRHGDKSTLLLKSKTIAKQVTSILNQGEWILMVEKDHLWVWLEGVLLMDQKWTSKDISAPWTSFFFEAQGNVQVKDFFLMNNPRVQVEYSNAWGEKTQVINLKDTQNVLVTETVYDVMGRPVITTKTTQLALKYHEPLLAYYPNFVTNDSPNKPDSVWYSGRLEGLVHQLNFQDQGVVYSRTVYAPDPLNNKEKLGLPGPAFSITGPFSTKFSLQANIDFLTNLFPANQGYKQQVKIQPNGRQEVKVFNRKNKPVALYQRVRGHDHQLSTYEYNQNNRLVKILPPLYHKKVNTFSKTDPWQAGDQHLSTEEKYWQRLGTHLSYDNSGRLRSKTTPDSGTVEYMYNSNGLRFMVYQSETKATEKVVYFSYNDQGQLSHTGHLTTPLPKSELLKYIDEFRQLPYTQDYQQFQYTGDEDAWQPNLRERLKKVTTFNDNEPFLEKFILNGDNQLELKYIYSMAASIQKSYTAGQISELFYPSVLSGSLLPLTHQYNKVGQLTGLGTPTDPTFYARFTYHPTGELATEEHQPQKPTTFSRQYKYNSPRFLEQISDPFLTETLSYTEGGYGQAGYGDGMIMRSSFNASWLNQVDPRSVSFKPEAYNISMACVTSLIDEGYLDNMRRPLKLFYPKAQELSVSCSEGEGVYGVAKALTESYFSQYGHLYAYGNHQELTKAKYFVGEAKEAPSPLQPITFAEISGLQSGDSENIWKLLCSSEFIIQDITQFETSAYYGNPGRDIFRVQALREELRKLELTYKDIFTPYVLPLKKLLLAQIGAKRVLTFHEFEKIFLKWEGLDVSSTDERVEHTKENAKRIWNILHKDYNDYIDPKFTNALKNYVKFIPDIVRILSDRFNHILGENTFDVKSYDIDSNGNHRLFYTGYNRYKLDYREGTNQIDKVKVQLITSIKPEQTYSMSHDAQGNVIQALHRGILNIEYDPTSQRTRRMKLTDGRVLRFYYDARGERVIKRVFSPDGHVSKETFYIRDERGKVLVDYQVTYRANQKSPDTVITGYVYGPRGLVGFIRNNAYYSVITDHEGSVRLVVKDGQVETAYDYLPYGQLMRCYGDNIDAQIAYRYTGKEYDEETGLYNYHARLYDPTIGRFYQIDPKEQYFSPYKYAGNSPVSLVDPDGEFAFLIACLIMAAVGAYLGGASANNNWNFTKWDWSSAKTWAGMGIGGLVGGLALPGAGASVAVLGTLGVGTAAGTTITASLAAGGAYLSTAAANHNWDPTKWDYKNPGTYNALFVGAASGAGIFGGVGSIKNAYTGLSSSLSRSIFVVGTAGSSTGLAYAGGVIGNGGEAAFWKWNWKDPATWNGVVTGGIGGAAIPAGMVETAKFFGKNIGLVAKNMKVLNKDIRSILMYRIYKTLEMSKKVGSVPKKVLESYKIGVARILDSLKSGGKVVGALGVAGGMIYLEGSGLNDSWSNWNMTDFQSYQVIFNGLLSMGGGGSNRPKKRLQGNIPHRCRRSGQCYRDLQQATKIMKEVKSVAKDFVKVLKNYDFESDGKSKLTFVEGMESKLKSLTVAVVATEEHLVLGLSNTAAPGAVYFKDRNQGSGVIVVAPKNEIGAPIIVHDNPRINRQLIEPIEHMHNLKNNFIDRLMAKGFAGLKLDQIMDNFMDNRDIPKLLQDKLSTSRDEKKVFTHLLEQAQVAKDLKDNEGKKLILSKLHKEINEKIDRLNDEKYPPFTEQDIQHIKEQYKKNENEFPSVVRNDAVEPFRLTAEERVSLSKQLEKMPSERANFNKLKETLNKKGEAEGYHFTDSDVENYLKKYENGKEAPNVSQFSFSTDEKTKLKGLLKEVKSERDNFEKLKTKINQLAKEKDQPLFTDTEVQRLIEHYNKNNEQVPNFLRSETTHNKIKLSPEARKDFKAILEKALSGDDVNEQFYCKMLKDKLNEKLDENKIAAFSNLEFQKYVERYNTHGDDAVAVLRERIENDIPEQDWRSLPDKNEFCSWAPTNCAEPHALTAAFKQNEIIGGEVHATGHEMEFIVAFDTKTLEHKPRCAQCEQTTHYITELKDYIDSKKVRLKELINIEDNNRAEKIKLLEKQRDKLIEKRSQNLLRAVNAKQKRQMQHKQKRLEWQKKLKDIREQLVKLNVPKQKLKIYVSEDELMRRTNQLSILPKGTTIRFDEQSQTNTRISKREIPSLNEEFIPRLNDNDWGFYGKNETLTKFHEHIFPHIFSYETLAIPAKSGASTLESWIVDLVKIIKPLFSGQYFFPNQHIKPSHSSHIPTENVYNDAVYNELAEMPDSTNFNSSSVLNNCMPWAELDQEYVEGITCMKSWDKVTIFPRVSENNQTVPLVEDHFSNCRSVQWNGRPSVHCEGEKSNMIYTPETQQRPFEQLNDQLIFLQVVLHEGKKAYDWLLSYFGGETKASSVLRDVSQATAITTVQKKLWKKLLVDAESLLTTIKDAGVEETKLRWASFILEDRKEDFEKLSKQSEAKVDDINVLTDDLHALKLELVGMLNLTATKNSHNERNFVGKMKRVSDLPISHAIESPSSLANYNLVDQRIGHAPYGLSFSRDISQVPMFGVTGLTNATMSANCLPN